MTKLYRRLCCFVLFFVAASASFHGYYEQANVVQGNAPEAGDSLSFFERMLEGSADRPYVYRQLLPAAANLIDRSVPEAIKIRFFVRQGSLPNAYVNAIAYSPTARNKMYFFRYLLLYIETFLFAFLAVYAMYLVCSALGMPSSVAVLSPVTVILLVPYMQNGGGIFYDYPELAFMALAVWIAIRFDWWWVIPIAVLGALNKESFLLFMPTLYPFFRLRRSRRASLIGVVVLCSVCGAIYYRLRQVFDHNPGSTVIVQWRGQLHYLLQPRALLYANVETYGLRVPAVYTLFPMTLLIWTVLRGWQHLPRAVQRHGQIAASINIPLYLLFCTPGEMRDLSMLYIVFLLLLAVNTNEWIKGADKSEMISVE